MNKKRTFIFSGALLCFAFIAFNVINSMAAGEPLVFDIVIRNTIIDLRNEFLNPILTGVTYLGNPNTIIFFCIVLLFFKKTRVEYGMPLGIAVSCSSTIQTIIKIIVHRPRPPVENFLILQGGFSFPSGHSCSGLVFYGVFAYLLFHTAVDKTVHKVIGRLFIILLIVIGISRIYVGVHYPTDVLGGWSLGLAILMVAISVIDRWKHPKIKENSNITEE
ncbi:MAG: phosphatase PAP2 family protein [Aminipila sp.]